MEQVAMSRRELLAAGAGVSRVMTSAQVLAQQAAGQPMPGGANWPLAA